MFICIAGKNKCAIEVVKFLINSNFNRKKILILPNNNDSGQDKWQPSLKKYARKKNIKIINLKELYPIEDLFFFSLEYEKIIKINKFKSNNLFNFHFSLLPRYRGCHTNYYQIFNGEKFSGITLHKIDSGIDSGDIIDQIQFKIPINYTAYDNYLKLMNYSVILFKKNLNKILNNRYKLRKQNLNRGTYFSRKTVNYQKILKIKMKKHSLSVHNKIRSLIFPAFQYPIVNGVKIKKSIYKNKKIYLKKL